MKQIGLQLYTIRDVFLKDEASVREGLVRLREMGYDHVEPAGFGPVDGVQFGKYVKDAGLFVSGAHYDLNKLFDETEATMRLFEGYGCRYIGTGGAGMLDTPDAVNAFIDKVNKVAPVLAREGFTFYYHNHSHEFMRLSNGKRAYDMLMEGFDPTGTAFELDCFWAQNAGIDAADFLAAHPGRFPLIHVKDMAVRKRTEGWGVENYMTEVGSGNMNYKRIMDAADESGVQYAIVEQDAFWIDDDPMKAAACSAAYIRKALLK